MPRVMSRGLNRTATQARTATGRSIAKITGLKVGDVRRSIVLQKASFSRWRSAIAISDRKIPLIKFRARQTKKGVSYRDYATRAKILLRHAFISVMPSGHKGVFRRATSKRLPIVEQKGPSLMEVFEGAQSEANRIYTESMQKLAKNIHDQVVLILRKKAG